MIYELKNCRDGSLAVYPTAVEIIDSGEFVTFRFTAAHSSFYCPFSGYNKLHSSGDACEVLIGSDPLRREYYEIEISAKGDLMLARMTYGGTKENGEPILGLDFVEDCFVAGKVEPLADGYTATVSLRKQDILTGDGEIFFNAYRLETDGGEMDKHLFALVPTMRPKFHAPSYFAYLKDYT